MSGTKTMNETSAGSDHVCPPWIGYMMLSPLRRLLEDPEAMLAGHVREGDLALDIGCAMGYFTLPLARLVGAGGRVICVDLQPKMLAGLRKRAEKRGVASRLDLRPCPADALPLDDVEGAVDVALIIHMVHETPDPARLFRQLASAMKPGGRVLFAEPRGHVNREAFERSLELARQAGLEAREALPVRWAHGRLLRKA